MLAVDGRLSAVIDFGCMGVGDPACDVMAAWAYLDADTRPAFRAELEAVETFDASKGRAVDVSTLARRSSLNLVGAALFGLLSFASLVIIAVLGYPIYLLTRLSFEQFGLATQLT